MPRSGLGAENLYDPDVALQSELDGVKEDDNPGAFVQATMNNYDLWLRVNNLNSRANDSNFTFFDPDGDDYVEISTTAYKTFATFIFRGTSIWTPSTLELVLSRSSANGVGYVRIYDPVNNEQIVEVSFSNTAKHIVTSTSISNLPATKVWFEFQAKRSVASAGKSRIHAAGLYGTAGGS